MPHTSIVALGILICLAFLWRFARTRQLYLTSVDVQVHGAMEVPLNLRDPRSIVHQALLGSRSIAPSSFFVRAFVLAVVALCLLPFKHYEPVLVWLVIILLAVYVPWCVGHGCRLKKMKHGICSSA